MQMRQRDVAALDAKYTKKLDAKAENDALRDVLSVAGRRRLHIKAVCRASAQYHASGVDNAASPDWQTPPLNGIISPWEMITMQKQLEGTQK